MKEFENFDDFNSEFSNSQESYEEYKSSDKNIETGLSKVEFSQIHQELSEVTEESFETSERFVHKCITGKKLEENNEKNKEPFKNDEKNIKKSEELSIKKIYEPALSKNFDLKKNENSEIKKTLNIFASKTEKTDTTTNPLLIITSETFLFNPDPAIKINPILKKIDCLEQNENSFIEKNKEILTKNFEKPVFRNNFDPFIPKLEQDTLENNDEALMIKKEQPIINKNEKPLVGQIEDFIFNNTNEPIINTKNELIIKKTDEVILSQNQENLINNIEKPIIKKIDETSVNINEDPLIKKIIETSIQTNEESIINKTEDFIHKPEDPTKKNVPLIKNIEDSKKQFGQLKKLEPIIKNSENSYKSIEKTTKTEKKSSENLKNPDQSPKNTQNSPHDPKTEKSENFESKTETLDKDSTKEHLKQTPIHLKNSDYSRPSFKEFLHHFKDKPEPISENQVVDMDANESLIMFHEFSSYASSDQEILKSPSENSSFMQLLNPRPEFSIGLSDQKSFIKTGNQIDDKVESENEEIVNILKNEPDHELESFERPSVNNYDKDYSESLKNTIHKIESTKVLIKDLISDSMPDLKTDPINHFTNEPLKVPTNEALKDLLKLSKDSAKTKIIETIKPTDSKEKNLLLISETKPLHSSSFLSKYKIPEITEEDQKALIEMIPEIIDQEIKTFIRQIPFKDGENEVDYTIEFLFQYLDAMASELKENEADALEAINTPVYQEPLSRIEYLQTTTFETISKFPNLELILPTELCSGLKVLFESLEIPSRQIYLQLLFDCVNEALNFIRPFGVTGIPDPWSTKPRILFGEAELDIVFQKISNYLLK